MHQIIIKVCNSHQFSLNKVKITATRPKRRSIPIYKAVMDWAIHFGTCLSLSDFRYNLIKLEIIVAPLLSPDKFAGSINECRDKGQLQGSKLGQLLSNIRVKAKYK